MRIKEIRVKNFRSILDETLDCDPLTALVGRNGSGKSTFLNALKLFYERSPRISEEDFHNRNLNEDIEIEITFVNLNDDAKLRFASYVENGAVKVVRVFSGNQPGKTGTYHGLRLQNPDFVVVRDAGGAMDVRRAYNALRSNESYTTLPTANSAPAVIDALTDWELQNPHRLERLRESDQFFGFTGVGQGYLGRFTRFIHVPAVRDANEDATEARGSSVTEILDLVVRNVLAEKHEFVQFQQRVTEEYREITDRTNLPELDLLQNELSNTLQSYVPSADVLLDWLANENLEINLPRAQVRLSEDGFGSAVDKTGHGLQRAFILTMLQQLAVATTADSIAAEGSVEASVTKTTIVEHLPNIVLAIEEPELYQHPSRQRHFSTVLFQLANGATPGVANKTQVFYTTHSPLFVGLDRFQQIRVVRKFGHEHEGPKTSKIYRGDLDSVADQLWIASGSRAPRFTADSLRTRLRAIMTPWMNEGFFADVAVLVEGEDDRAAIHGTAMSMNIDLDGKGIAVIPCMGKTNLDRPMLIFRQLGIPVYVVWDGDFNNPDPKPEVNKRLIAFNGAPKEKWPEGVWQTFACFKVDLETTIKNEIGVDEFERLFSKAKDEFGYKEHDDVRKNPVVFQRFVEIAASEGFKCETLEDIVKNIEALREHSVSTGSSNLVNHRSS